jgi:hypothetical protein
VSAPSRMIVATGVVGIRTNAAKTAPVMAPALHKTQNSRQNNRFSIMTWRSQTNLKMPSLIASEENTKRIGQMMFHTVTWFDGPVTH